MTELATLEAVSRARRAGSVSRHLGAWAVSGEVTELSAAEAVAASTTGESLGLGVGAISGNVPRLTASIAIVAAWLAATSHTTHSRTALWAITGKMVLLTAIEAASSLGTHSSWCSLGSLGAISGHMTLTTTGETTIIGHGFLSTITKT